MQCITLHITLEWVVCKQNPMHSNTVIFLCARATSCKILFHAIYYQKPHSDEIKKKSVRVVLTIVYHRSPPRRNDVILMTFNQINQFNQIILWNHIAGDSFIHLCLLHYEQGHSSHFLLQELLQFFFRLFI